MNYCRHVGSEHIKPTGKLVFFEGVPPMPVYELDQWAFWKNPERSDGFPGKLIGESPNMRADRMAVYRAWHPLS